MVGAPRGGTGSASAPRKVAFFGSCLVNYQATDIGKATIQVLEKNGVHVVVPEQRCCGMPSFDIGDTAAIQQAASANVASFLPWVEKGYDIVVPVPSCSLMWKREYPRSSVAMRYGAWRNGRSISVNIS